jgi:hypothetical protein
VGVRADDLAAYSLNSGLRVKQSLLVRYSDNVVAATTQPIFTFRVPRHDSVQPMNSAINLDDEPRVVANEIHDIRSEGRLAAKVRTMQVEPAQQSPQAFLCRRLFTA